MNMNIITATNDTAIMKDDTQTKYAHFASVDAFTEYNDKEYCKSTYDTDTSWTLRTKGLKMVNIINTRGMQDSIMERLNGAIELPDMDRLKNNALTNEVVMAESGFICDMNAYYAGEDDCMINMDYAVKPAKTIWLASSIISQGDVRPDSMINRGIALIRAVKTLQTSGYNVGLVAYIHGSSSGCKSLVTVVIKQPHEPLNENSVAAAFAHPSFFRTLGHNAVARLNNSVCGIMNKLPTPTVEQFEGAFLDESQLTILNGKFDYSDALTEEIAVDWIKAELNKALYNMGA